LQKETTEEEEENYDNDFEAYGGEQNPAEDEIDEEEMLDIAEKCFAKMAQEIKDRGLTVE
jgi:hypothetical protein